MTPPSNRRDFMKSTAVLAGATLLSRVPVSAQQSELHQATGVRVGEVTDTTAIVWTRLTRHTTRNNAGVVFAEKVRRGKEEPPVPPVEEIEGACPAMNGRVRVRYGRRDYLSDARVTDWASVTAEKDGIHQFRLTDLEPGATYHYRAETQDADGRDHAALLGKFYTAPEASMPSDFRFCVMTCQGYQDRDHADGHPIYPSMLALEPRFIAMTGDLVYYDSNAPRAVTPALARLHWERMFSLPRLVETLRQTSTYWLKDDHDTITDDCWPGMKAGELTFAEGQRIFREQTPFGSSSYRTVRWGRDLQVWFTDGRDFRSPNKMPDGPGKTIWGAEQKAWFQRTVKESTATWKALVSPTPLVGPDRENKNDNHANAGFAHEGNELRAWLQANVPDNFFVICGDRHWQYFSVHPETGVREFSVGAASDSHAGGTPGEDPRYHKFHRVKGGFLSVQLTSSAAESRIDFRHHDVDGRVVHEFTASRRPS